ncbi:MAG: methyltransferase domain-containing protein [Planctomycetota bacterium]
MTNVTNESTDWFTPENIARYYRATRWQYRALWTGKQSLALHYGYWDQAVKDHIQALDRMNEELARRANICAADYVLDAGCGWGGSCIWLVQKHGARTLGINIEPEQVQKAQEKARLFGVQDRTSFIVADYHRIPAAEGSFDVVWAMESFCHSDHKDVCAREAFRVLKPGGRLVLCDYFRASRRLAAPDEMLLRKWLGQWVVRDLATFGEFREHLLSAGFIDVNIDEATANIYPSSRRLYLTGVITGPLAILFRGVGLHTRMAHGNWKSSILQYRALKRSTWRYGIFSGRRP